MHHWVQRGEGGVINDGMAAAAVLNALFSALPTPNHQQPCEWLPRATLPKKVMIMMPELFNMHKLRWWVNLKGCGLGLGEV